MADYFNFAANLARAQAMHEIPDAASGIDRYNDELSRRGDMLQAARDSDIEDLTDKILGATDMQTVAALSEWFIDEILKDGHAALIAHAKAGGSFFTEALTRAAKAKAENDWDKRYGS